eukprot:67356_1
MFGSILFVIEYVNMVKLLPNIRIPFGIEIESIIFKSKQHQHYSDVLKSLNLNYTSWSCLEDKTIETQCDTLKCELISPKLHYDTSTMNQLHTICDTLQHTIHADVNSSCGFHVHVDASDLSIKDIVSIAINYSFFEEVIDSFMHKTRRRNNNRYIRSIVEPIANHYDELCLILNDTCDYNYSKQHLSILDMINPKPRKLHKLNVTNTFYYSLSQIGINKQEEAYINTIENRHHDATLDYYDMLHWIKFNLRFIYYSQHKPVFNINNAINAKEKLELLARFVEDDEMICHYLARARTSLI